MMSSSDTGRARLPTCVVRIRSLLRFIDLPCIGRTDAVSVLSVVTYLPAGGAPTLAVWSVSGRFSVRPRGALDWSTCDRRGHGDRSGVGATYGSLPDRGNGHDGRSRRGAPRAHPRRASRVRAAQLATTARHVARDQLRHRPRRAGLRGNHRRRRREPGPRVPRTDDAHLRWRGPQTAADPLRPSVPAVARARPIRRDHR